MELSERLMNLRKQKMVSQRDVAKACGLSIRSVNGYETGNRVPSNEALTHLADYYDVPVACLIGPTPSQAVSNEMIKNLHKSIETIALKISRMEEEVSYVRQGLEELEELSYKAFWKDDASTSDFRHKSPYSLQ